LKAASSSPAAAARYTAHHVREKVPLYFASNFVKCWQIFKNFHPQN